MAKMTPPASASAEELRDLVVHIVGAYDDLVAAELAHPQKADVLEAARSALRERINEAATATGTRRRR
jgi:hypothetical protein